MKSTRGGRTIPKASGRMRRKRFIGTRNGTRCSMHRGLAFTVGSPEASSTLATTPWTVRWQTGGPNSPVTQTIKVFSYRHLLDEVSRFAGVLQRQGARKGDRVIIYMPMVPEAAIAMLACARVGLVHSVV